MSIIFVAVVTAALLHASNLTAEPGCDAACEVTKLGWRVVDPGPPLWFRTGDGAGPRIEVAVADLGRPTGDGVSWAKAQLSAGKGAFGPLGACRGNMPVAPHKTALLTCSVPPAAEGPRQGGIFVIETTAGLQVIGMVAPDSVKKTQFNYGALDWVASGGRDPGALARAARAAIAMSTAGAYYIVVDAGPAVEEIEAVYHFWNRQSTVASGVVDQGADFVLFKNGEVWRTPGAGPRDIDPVKFKEARWRDWGLWRQQPGGILITLNDQAPTLMSPNTFQRYDPAPGAPQRVEGRWRWSRSYETPNVLVNTEQLFKLHADGRFEIDASSGAIGLPNYAVPGMPAMPGTPGARMRRSGRYRLDGYTLHLADDDGRKSSNLFYWAGDGQSDRYAMFLINGASWLGGLAR